MVSQNPSENKKNEQTQSAPQQPPVAFVQTGPEYVIQELVALRHKEIAELQKAQDANLKASEARGQQQLKSMMDSLTEDEKKLFNKLSTVQTEFAQEAQTLVADAKARLVEASAPLKELQPAFIPSGLTVLFPYYLTLYNCKGEVIWAGTAPASADLAAECYGSGSGLFGTGECSCTVRAEWWYRHFVSVSRWYSYTVNAPFRGFYIVYANDGFFTSKEAKVSIDMDIIGYQYGYKSNSHTNLLFVGGDNINVNKRFDENHVEYYGDLLGGPDHAYLRVTESLYVYARGSGSHAELDFATGAANFLGAPWVYVS
jgi:hypothetical protein